MCRSNNTYLGKSLTSGTEGTDFKYACATFKADAEITVEFIGCKAISLHCQHTLSIYSKQEGSK